MTVLNRPAFFVGRHQERLQQGRATPQENPSLDTPENLVGMVDTLVNLQDLHEPIVTTSAINLSRRRYIIFLIDLSFSSPYDTLTSASF
jgi:hypothetical protein